MFLKAFTVMKSRASLSRFGRAFVVLTNADKRKIVVISLLQILMGGLDLLGVIAIGMLGALSVSGLESSSPGDRVGRALEILHLQDLAFQTQALILGVGAVVILVGRTILSIIFTRRTLFFLSRRGAKVSADLISRLLAQPLLVVQSRTTQETIYAVTTGVVILMLQVLATAVVWFADLALLVVMMIGLLYVDPVTATATFLVFFLVGFFLFKFMHVRAGNLGSENSILSIKSNEKIFEVFASYRESVVRNRRDYYARNIGQLRYSLANTSAELGFLPYVSKYVIESTVVIGAVLLGATQFIFQDASHAIATLAIFLAAGTRIAPAVLRLQQGTVTIKSGLGAASPTLDLIDALGNSPLTENVDDRVDIVHEGFIPEVQISEVSLTYPNKLTPAIAEVSLNIPVGTSIAFVGPSGAGKTTMIDVLLGVLNPDSGSVLISGLPPLFAVAKWPGAVSYVPQDVVIATGTIRENIAFGYPVEEATEELIMSALKVAQLDQFVSELPDGVDTQVGERGARISGGQRQRLGIARAMFTRPQLLVLDEATSSLDGETEATISDAIHALRGSTTVVLIAHRLSTVRNVDKVVYLADGKMLAAGTFTEVRNAVPDFDIQAKIMGL
jgi:ABC-type multidrug transport system fused ATPase/permease subunit